ncbi:hypothetical protein B0H13DRAFT_1881217 [Mycena leptocephala]|nr:hypothetical protein B0H13DRAFT_1881217 [Mycena leptocephala]
MTSGATGDIRGDGSLSCRGGRYYPPGMISALSTATHPSENDVPSLVSVARVEARCVFYRLVFDAKHGPQEDVTKNVTKKRVDLHWSSECMIRVDAHPYRSPTRTRLLDKGKMRMDSVRVYHIATYYGGVASGSLPVARAADSDRRAYEDASVSARRSAAWEYPTMVARSPYTSASADRGWAARRIEKERAVVLPRWLRELPLQQPQLNSLVALGLQNALNLRELSTERCTISTRMTKSSSTASFLPQHASAMYTPASLLPGPFPAAGANTREYSRCKFYRRFSTLGSAPSSSSSRIYRKLSRTAVSAYVRFRVEARLDRRNDFDLGTNKVSFIDPSGQNEKDQGGVPERERNNGTTGEAHLRRNMEPRVPPRHAAISRHPGELAAQALPHFAPGTRALGAQDETPTARETLNSFDLPPPARLDSRGASPFIRRGLVWTGKHPLSPTP